MKTICLSLLFVLSSTLLFSQSPCATPEHQQFDFWVGEWELSWGDSLGGTNSITKTMNGCVIEENFHDPKTGYKGQSVSVYNSTKKKWEQTWVDNNGGYIALEGAFDGKEMMLYSSNTKDGVKTDYRMHFHQITKDKFTWNWDKSTDGGKSWQPSWVIYYTRKK